MSEFDDIFSELDNALGELQSDIDGWDNPQPKATPKPTVPKPANKNPVPQRTTAPGKPAISPKPALTPKPAVSPKPQPAQQPVAAKPSPTPQPSNGGTSDILRTSSEKKISKTEELQKRLEEARAKRKTQKLTSSEGLGDWKEAKTATGKVYYYNTKTKETSWKRPGTEGGPPLSGGGAPASTKSPTPSRPEATSPTPQDNRPGAVSPGINRSSSRPNVTSPGPSRGGEIPPPNRQPSSGAIGGPAKKSIEIPPPKKSNEIPPPSSQGMRSPGPSRGGEIPPPSGMRSPGPSRGGEIPPPSSQGMKSPGPSRGGEIPPPGSSQRPPSVNLNLSFNRSVEIPQSKPSFKPPVGAVQTPFSSGMPQSRPGMTSPGPSRALSQQQLMQQKLQTMPWYFGKFSRQETESLLFSSGKNCFLVRDSSVDGCYACSMYEVTSKSITHTLIKPSTKGGYEFEDQPEYGSHPDVVSLVQNSKIVGVFVPAPKR